MAMSFGSTGIKNLRATPPAVILRSAQAQCPLVFAVGSDSSVAPLQFADSTTHKYNSDNDVALSAVFNWEGYTNETVNTQPPCSSLPVPSLNNEEKKKAKASPDELIGRAVQKQFDADVFTGRVVSYDAKMKWFRICANLSPSLLRTLTLLQSLSSQPSVQQIRQLSYFMHKGDIHMTMENYVAAMLVRREMTHVCGKTTPIGSAIKDLTPLSYDESKWFMRGTGMIGWLARLGAKISSMPTAGIVSIWQSRAVVHLRH